MIGSWNCSINQSFLNSLTFPPAFTVSFLSKRKIWWLYCLIINTQQCPVSWLHGILLEDRFAWWQFGQTKSIRPMCIFIVLQAWEKGISMERQWLQMWHPRLTQGSQYPPRPQILRIDREGRIDDVIMHVTWLHLRKNILVDSNCHKFAMTQNVRKRCCWHCYIWGDWFTFYQSHYYYHRMPEFMRKRSILTLK